MRRGAPPSGSCRTSPVMSLSPTRRTARPSCWARYTARASAISTSPRSPRSRMRRPSPARHLHFMHPVKSRTAIRRAFAEFGVRSFALDSEDELKKIAEETGGCRDLTLWVRVAVPSRNSKIPLERKFGTTGAKAARLLVKARQAAKELGITFHVGSQTSTPEAYTMALAEVGKLDRQGRRGARSPRRRRRLPVGLRRQRAGAALGLRARDHPMGSSAAHRRALPADVRAGARPGGGGRSRSSCASMPAGATSSSSTMAATARCSMRRIWASTSRSG